jgi:hypothetical protein
VQAIACLGHEGDGDHDRLSVMELVWNPQAKQVAAQEDVFVDLDVPQVPAFLDELLAGFSQQLCLSTPRCVPCRTSSPRNNPGRFAVSRRWRRT